MRLVIIISPHLRLERHLDEGQLQFLAQGPREMIAADGNIPLPDSVSVGDDQVGRVGAQRDNDRRRWRIGRVVGLRAQIVEAIETAAIEMRKGAKS